MLLHPWDLYDHNYQPKQWTNEIVQVIKHGLSVSPNHPGINHYYIHAIEASSRPGDALKSANLLATAMPDVSHITHMPSHIYIRTGNYNQGITVNEKGIAGYNKYLQLFEPVGGNMPLYNLHNLHMKMNCAQMAGNFSKAIAAANELQQAIPVSYLSMGNALGNYVQYLHQSPIITLVRFGKWKEILSISVDDTLDFSPILQRFARGVALARTNNTDAATDELKALQTKMQTPVLKEPLGIFNSAYAAAEIAKNLLQGVIVEEKKDYVSAINFYSAAVRADDHLIYNEPRDWLIPARQYLGNALLKAKRYSEAIRVFQKDLEINPKNGWSLTGLGIAYKAIKDNKGLKSNNQNLKVAWLSKDIKIDRAVF
jgi:tetratricopeptide (TPR) repeat protein